MLAQIRMPKPPNRAAATSSRSAIAPTKRVQREDNAQAFPPDSPHARHSPPPVLGGLHTITDLVTGAQVAIRVVRVIEVTGEASVNACLPYPKLRALATSALSQRPLS
jgi:hypothetical protein